MSDATEAAITALQQDVARLSDVNGSAITLINGFSKALNDALAEARNKGASPAQLAELSDLHATLTARSGELAAAVSSNPLPAAAPAGDDTVTDGGTAGDPVAAGAGSDQPAPDVTADPPADAPSKSK